MVLSRSSNKTLRDSKSAIVTSFQDVRPTESNTNAEIPAQSSATRFGLCFEHKMDMLQPLVQTTFLHLLASEQEPRIVFVGSAKLAALQSKSNRVRKNNLSRYQLQQHHYHGKNNKRNKLRLWATCCYT